MRISPHILVLFFSCFAFFLRAQMDVFEPRKLDVNLHKKQARLNFFPSPEMVYGLDVRKNADMQGNDSVARPIKSVVIDQSDVIRVGFKRREKIRLDSLSFFIEGNGKVLNFKVVNDTLIDVFLPKMMRDYIVRVNHKSRNMGQFQVVVYVPIVQKVVLVPLCEFRINSDELGAQLNQIYGQAGVELDLQITPRFKTKEFNAKTRFDNPSPSNDRYTNQMRIFRDSYFEQHPQADKKAYYIFLINGFVDTTITGYMPRNKAFGFVSCSHGKSFSSVVARELGFGIGMLERAPSAERLDTSFFANLMGNGFGTHLTFEQWELLRHSSRSFSFYDNDEDVRTNNGYVAYYFWKENKDGSIHVEQSDFLKSILRPFKKNHISHQLHITDYFYTEQFRIGRLSINLYHIVGWLLLFSAAFFVRIRFHQFVTKKLKRPALLKLFTRFTLFILSLVVAFWFFQLVQSGYARFQIKSGEIPMFATKSMEGVVKSVRSDRVLSAKPERLFISEIFRFRNNKWQKHKRRKVLYFSIIQDTLGGAPTMRYEKDSDLLDIPTLSFKNNAESHYLVFNYYTRDKHLFQQRIFNHLGVELTDKLTHDDPAKRILLFVNGYRPTTVGHSFESNFKDIKTKGLEYPSSNNLIYSFDRYAYWQPWNEIDSKFQKRINAQETFFADGHFSVSTSNHRSLLNFSTLSTIYPKICSNKNRHTCRVTATRNTRFWEKKQIKTVDLLPVKSNVSGFNIRKRNGKIAGRNLFQLLNELPNKSKNDTLFIVAHSMGYAYTLGILEVMRGKINFGGLYIIAPENAGAGSVDPNEWKEIWQYGSNFNRAGGDAPCLQDGVAPQVNVAGLPAKNRAYIPANLYHQKGFFNAHFIGYYTWLFTIPSTKPGYIQQR